jgi:hypothetical protein
MFEYAEVHLPATCLRDLWWLTLSDREVGGQIHPRETTVAGHTACPLSCDVELIEGTVLEEKPDSDTLDLYEGKDRPASKNTIRMATTTFRESHYVTAGSCPAAPQTRVNLVFHTHPLLMVRDPITHMARIALPSLGDIYAHGVVSQLVHAEQHGRLNGLMVVAFEGLYVFNITPRKFAELWQLYQREGHATVERVVFDELRPYNQAFFKAMKPMCDARPEVYGTRGAPMVHTQRWRRPHAPRPSLDFPFATGVYDAEVVRFAQKNPFVDGLRRHGYSYMFYPLQLLQSDEGLRLRVPVAVDLTRL